AVDSTFDILFFSSRRRHTRSKRDWSSDVCSSDLHLCGLFPAVDFLDVVTPAPGKSTAGNRPQRWRQEGGLLRHQAQFPHTPSGEIGRASCREREELAVVAG